MDEAAYIKKNREFLIENGSDLFQPIVHQKIEELSLGKGKKDGELRRLARILIKKGNHIDKAQKSSYCTEIFNSSKNTIPTRILDIKFIGPATFSRVAEKSESIARITSTQEIDKIILHLDDENLEKQLLFDNEHLRKKILNKVPKEYHNLLGSFSKYGSDLLPENRHNDYQICLNDGVKREDLGYSPFYKMSLDELKICHKYITDNLKNGFIETSSAP